MSNFKHKLKHVLDEWSHTGSAVVALNIFDKLQVRSYEESNQLNVNTYDNNLTLTSLCGRGAFIAPSSLEGLNKMHLGLRHTYGNVSSLVCFDSGVATQTQDHSKPYPEHILGMKI